MEQILKSLTLEFFGEGKHKITPEKLIERENSILLDVRSKEEASSISIRMEYHSNVESIHIPINEISERIDEISKEKFVAVFCPANVRSAIVYAYLLSKGFSEVRIVDGGYSAFTEAFKPGQILKVIQSKN